MIILTNCLVLWWHLYGKPKHFFQIMIDYLFILKSCMLSKLISWILKQFHLDCSSFICMSIEDLIVSQSGNLLFLVSDLFPILVKKFLTTIYFCIFFCHNLSHIGWLLNWSELLSIFKSCAFLININFDGI